MANNSLRFGLMLKDHINKKNNKDLKFKQLLAQKPTYTDQILLQHLLAVHFAKIFCQCNQTKIIASFTDQEVNQKQQRRLTPRLPLLYNHARYYHARYYLFFKCFLDVAIAKNLRLYLSTFRTFCQCNSRKLLAKIFGQCNQGCTTLRDSKIVY